LREDLSVPGSVLLAEVGLTLIFTSWTLTRAFQRRALRRYGLVHAFTLARTGAAVPVWVSLCNIAGWVLAVTAGTWLMVHMH
jgi:hypothetical protein